MKTNLPNVPAFIAPKIAETYALPSLIRRFQSDNPKDMEGAKNDLSTVLIQVSAVLDALTVFRINADKDVSGMFDDNAEAGVLGLLSGIVALCANASDSIASFEYEQKHGRLRVNALREKGERP